MLDWLNRKLAVPLRRVGRIAAGLSTSRNGPNRAAADAGAAERESDARLRFLTENMSDVIIRYAATGERLYVSPSVGRYGYKPEALIGGMGVQHIHAEDIAKVDDAVTRIREGWKPPPDTVVESRLRTTWGEWVWMEGKPNPICDADGRLLEVVWLWRDIQTRKAAEAALIESEARYRMLADNASDIIIEHDLDFRLKYMSPSSRRLGFDPQAAQGQNSLAFVHPDDRAATIERRREALSGRPVKNLVTRVRGPTSDWVWMDCNMSAIRGRDGVVTGFISALRDVSERRAAEQALVESERRYRLLAENSLDVILQYDAHGRVQYVSPSISQWGYRPEDIIGKGTGFILHDDDAPRIVERRAAIYRGEPSGTIQTRVKRADGGWAWVETNPSAIRDDAGEVRGILMTIRDITKRRRAEADMQAVNAELARVARISTLGAFAASIAHEVNQPLAAAAVDSEAAMRWLSGDSPNMPRATRAIQRANDNVRRAGAVVSRLRSMVVKDRPNHAPFDPDEAVREVLALVAREGQSSDIVIQPALAAGRPAIVGDRIQFQQVILNLLGNAIDAVREAEDGDRLIVVRSTADDGGVEITVEDRGPGISPDKIGQIFDTLFTTKMGGTGLGLPISRSIVEAHGGRLWAEHAQPRGAAFKLRLPLAAGADRADRQPARAQP